MARVAKQPRFIRLTLAWTCGSLLLFVVSCSRKVVVVVGIVVAVVVVFVFC